MNHFAPEVDEFVRRGIAYAQRHDGLRGLQIVGRLQAQKRQIVARIASVALHAAHHENLPHGIARERRGVPRIAHLIHLARLQIQAFDELERLIARKNTFVDNVFFVEGPHILVETPKTACRGADLNMEHHVHEPHHLHRLGKGLRWVFGDDAAILGNAAQFGSARLVGARRSLVLRLVGHAMRIRHKALRLDNACAPEIDLRGIFLGLRHARINVALAFLNISAHADTQHFFMVACRLARHAILQANAQNIVGLKLLDIFGHHGIGNIFHRFALPIRQSFQDCCLIFRRNAIRILRTRAELVDIAHIPAAALEIGVKIRTAIGIRWRADDKLVVENHAAHVLENMVDDFRAENGHRIARELLVSLRLQYQMLSRNARRSAEMTFPHAVDTWRTHCIPPYNKKAAAGEMPQAADRIRETPASIALRVSATVRRVFPAAPRRRTRTRAVPSAFGLRHHGKLVRLTTVTECSKAASIKAINLQKTG